MSTKNLPTYQEIVIDFKEKIHSGYYRVGDLLPTEQELQSEYATSRTTIRNAISVLENEGYVSRQQGRGTMLLSRRPIQNLNYISSFTETLKERGYTAETGLLSIRKTHPSPMVASKLEISMEEYIYSIQRTKLVDGKVIGFLNNRILAEIAPNLEEKVDYLRDHGLYETLEKLYNLHLQSAVENISVHMSSHFENEIFEISDSVPLLKSERITQLEDRRIFEYVTTYVLTENYEYQVYLVGRTRFKNSLPSLDEAQKDGNGV